jgi:hypothetical protein
MKSAEGSIGEWARQTFGGAQLGDARRSARLVKIAAGMAAQPAGTVTGVFATSAEREGAFRLLENVEVTTCAVAEAVTSATARSAAHQELVYVPVDSTSLSLSDRARKREVGRVGVNDAMRGLHVMNAIAVGQDGMTLGMLDQQWWARTEAIKHVPPWQRKCHGTRYMQRETRYWLQALTNVQSRLREQAPRTRAFYQLDRGADCWPLFSHAIEQRLLLTVRSAYDRRVSDGSGKPRYLNEYVQAQPVLGELTVQLAETPQRSARQARMKVRACAVTIQAQVTKKRRQAFQLNAVLVQESPRAGSPPLRWLLLTTHPVSSLVQACAVVTAYTLRWRVEDMHRAWKNGLCCIEDTQLHSRQAITKWATIAAAVATRAIRLAQLLRTEPDAAAIDEFTEHEMDAAFLIQGRARDRREKLSMRDMIMLAADIGGFAHKYSKRLPGPKTIARGLERIEVLAAGLRNLEQMR